MASVYYLLDAHKWDKDTLDITVYQQGWRLGGKCASGRNMAQGARVEEHGIHFWFGAYHNAFRWIQDCYKRLEDLGYHYNWQELLIPAPTYIGFESLGNDWDMWKIQPFAWPVPPGGELPLSERNGESSHYISEYVSAGLKLMMKQIVLENNKITHEPNTESNVFNLLKSKSKQHIELVLEKLNEVSTHFEQASSIGQFHQSHEIVKDLLDKIEYLLNFIGEVFPDYLKEHQTLRRIFVVVDLGLTMLKGFIHDEVFSKGLDSINNIDFIQWLKKHGASEVTLTNTLVISYYDGSFAYRDGDKRFPSAEAGTTIKGILIALLTCDKSMFFKFRGSMAEIVFTPYYLLLKEFGVKFKFFHKVQNIGLSDDKKSITHIDIDKQVHLKSGNEDDYDPLVDVKGIRCWPSEPKYDQLVEGDELKNKSNTENVNLESFWTAWNGEQIRLESGKDFDDVIFAIPIGSVPFLCTELLEASLKWRDMISHIETVPTQSLQLWTTRNAMDMGWPFKDCGVYTTYTEPLDTWCRNPDLIPLEDWPDYNAPKDVYFFTGVLRDAGITPPPDFHEFPEMMNNRVYGQFLEFLVNDMDTPFPRVKPSQGLNDWFNWSLLYDTASQIGHNRLHTQYFRANVDPSERYVLSVENSSEKRLAADETDFENLYITGDWIRTPLNSGCFEAAMMAGIQTARALTKVPLTIIGEHAFKTHTEVTNEG